MSEFCGRPIFNRSTQRLKSSRRPNDSGKWVRVENAFEAVVTQDVFDRAKEARRRRGRHWTDDEMLDGLRDLLVEHGEVTSELIKNSELPSVKSYTFRFRGLVAAYEAAGVAGVSLSRATITRFRMRCVTKDMTKEFERCASLAGAKLEKLTHRTYRLNDVVVRILCTRCRYERSHPCWKVTVRFSPAVDFVIWVRMNEANDHVSEIYLLPTASFPDHQFLWPSTLTLQRYDQFGHESIKALFGLS